MKILITGSEGQLGRSLNKLKPLDFSLINCPKSKLDLTNKFEIKNTIYSYRPDWIINCGAYTKVLEAENNHKLAYSLNQTAPKQISEILSETGGKLIHLSTDYVFDGKSNKPYKVNDIKNPINIYGASKAAGEREVENIFKDTCQATILRTSGIIGPFGKNFSETMLQLFSDRENVNVICDQISSPTSSLRLSFVIWEIIKKFSKRNISHTMPKIMHYSDDGICSWYDVACKINELAFENQLIKKKVKISPISSNQFHENVKRPKFSKLDSSETHKILNLKPIHWEESIKSYLKNKK